MLPSEFEAFVKYAIGISILVALIALWRVRKRGPSGLFLVGASTSFALLLWLVLEHADDSWLFAIGFVVAGCMVADFFVRKQPPQQ